jgi:hypothetical protein
MSLEKKKCNVHNEFFNVGYEVVIVVVIKSSVFCDIMSFKQLKDNFEQTRHLHLQSNGDKDGGVKFL